MDEGRCCDTVAEGTRLVGLFWLWSELQMGDAPVRNLLRPFALALASFRQSANQSVQRHEQDHLSHAAVTATNTKSVTRV